MSNNRVTRRQFLNYSLLGVGGFMAAGMLLPMARFAVDPLLQVKAEGEFVKTAQKASELTDEPVRVDFTFEQVDAWYKADTTDSAWIYKEGEEIIALSPKCKHLGCTVSWAGDPTQPDRFFCACHAGRYEKNGVNVPKTPPTAALDMFQVEISEDGYIMLGKKFDNTHA
jgi:menaquinol-cytochrome c reductase iron-sulfur subunit